MRLSVVIRFVLALSVLIILAGCNDTKAKIVGKWMPADKQNKSTIEFLSDSTIIMVSSEGERYPGKWSMLDDGRVKMDFAKPYVFKVSFNGKNEMTTVDENNKSESLNRVQ